MSGASVLVESATERSKEKFWDILAEVFGEVPRDRLQEGMTRLGVDTKFYAVEGSEGYLRVLFVTPVTIADARFGGIGGVCTRRSVRGNGYGRVVLESAIAGTASTFGTLLLWTRIPAYFEQFGFVEMSQMFVPEAGASTPMLFFHTDEARFAATALRGLPRVYF